MTQDRATEIAEKLRAMADDMLPTNQALVREAAALLTAAREKGRRAGLEEAAIEAARWMGLKGLAIAYKLRALAKEPKP